jgi:hypothetical protein
VHVVVAGIGADATEIAAAAAAKGSAKQERCEDQKWL